jgi:hypothetical protein
MTQVYRYGGQHTRMKLIPSLSIELTHPSEVLCHSRNPESLRESGILLQERFRTSRNDGRFSMAGVIPRRHILLERFLLPVSLAGGEAEKVLAGRRPRMSEKSMCCLPLKLKDSPSAAGTERCCL